MTARRSVAIFAFFLAMGAALLDAWAGKKPATSPPTATLRQGCTLSEAGIGDEKGFETFFFGFKKAVKEDDFDRIANYAFYPLRITSRFGLHTIQSRAELMPLIRLAMNDRVKSAVEGQSLARLSCRDEGVSFGNGKVWVAQRGKRIGVFAIELN